MRFYVPKYGAEVYIRGYHLYDREYKYLDSFKNEGIEYSTCDKLLDFTPDYSYGSFTEYVNDGYINKYQEDDGIHSRVPKGIDNNGEYESIYIACTNNVFFQRTYFSTTTITPIKGHAWIPVGWLVTNHDNDEFEVWKAGVNNTVWSIDSDNKLTIDVFATFGTANINYFAIPIYRYRNITITYSGGDYGSVKVEGAKAATLPTPEKIGYKFEGWYLSEDFSNESFVGKGGDSILPNEDLTLYPRFISKEYIVTFDANGGTVNPVFQVVPFGEIYNILPTPLKSGYEFGGWYLGDEKITDITPVATAKDHTLVAKWIGGKIKITKKDLANTVDVSAIGKLKLYSSKDNYLSPIAEEAEGGITYEGPTNVVYKVILELSDSGEDFSWSALGVSVAGQYVSSYSFSVPPGGELDIAYVLKAKNFYDVTLEFDSSLGNAYIASPSSPDKNGKYVEGRDIVIGYAANEGCKLKFAKYFNSNGGLIGGEDSPDGKNLAFTLKYNTRVVLTFDTIKCNVDVKSDDPSSIAFDKIEGEAEGVDYGTEITISATVKEGYFFDGWYLDGLRVSEKNEYTVSVTHDCTYIAKAKVKVTFNVEYEDNRDDTSITIDENCTISINGVENTLPFETSVVLGSGIDYNLNTGNWYFQLWEDESNTALALPISGYLEPRSSTTLIAEVTSAVKKKTIIINFKNGDSEIESDYLADAIDITPSYESVEAIGSLVKAVVVESGWYTLSFNDEINLSDGNTLFFNTASGGQLKFENGEYALFVNGDTTVDVDYGTGGTKTITIDFADGSDRTKGEIRIGDDSSTATSTPIKYEGNRLDEVIISAIAYNGWSFVGWYRDVAGYANLFSDDSTVTIAITADMNLYAKFVKNLNAIYEWEGSSEKKMMTWRSKTYIASKPFNPSACRIDSTRYPIPVLSFEQFTSPDSVPTAKATLTNIQSQKARRLPVRRMEKYLQVYVEHDDEVDAILVGTSMEGLAI